MSLRRPGACRSIAERHGFPVTGRAHGVFEQRPSFAGSGRALGVWGPSRSPHFQLPPGGRGRPLRRRIAVAGVALTVYGVGLGFLGGVAVDRMLFDRERNAAVSRLEQASRKLHGALMELERETGKR
jgi:hypothetical protein